MWLTSHTETVYSSADSYFSSFYPGLALINFVNATNDFANSPNCRHDDHVMLLNVFSRIIISATTRLGRF